MTANPLIALRKEMGMNRTEFCLKSGMSYPTLYTIEKGRMKEVRPKTLGEIVKFTQADPDKFRADYAAWREQQAT